jgi:hypothetical protein
MDALEHAIDTKKAAALLGLSPGTLAVQRSRRQGPPVHYSGMKPVYFPSELREWQRGCRIARDQTSACQADAKSSQGTENKEAPNDTSRNGGQ